jgi:hypothetical protein
MSLQLGEGEILHAASTMRIPIAKPTTLVVNRTAARLRTMAFVVVGWLDQQGNQSSPKPAAPIVPTSQALLGPPPGRKEVHTSNSYPNLRRERQA